MSLLLEIVTPEKVVFSDKADSVVLPTTEGDVGVLSGHIPLLTTLTPGELQVITEGRTEYLTVDKGFAQILGDKVSVLTEGAIDVEEIDLSAVEDAQLRAEKALAEAAKQKMDPAEIEQLETIVRFSLAQKMAKEKRR
jgi:F-type H+-transporting ATPase subunit epsilon